MPALFCAEIMSTALYDTAALNGAQAGARASRRRISPPQLWAAPIPPHADEPWLHGGALGVLEPPKRRRQHGFRWAWTSAGLPPQSAPARALTLRPRQSLRQAESECATSHLTDTSPSQPHVWLGSLLAAQLASRCLLSTTIIINQLRCRHRSSIILYTAEVRRILIL